MSEVFSLDGLTRTPPYIRRCALVVFTTIRYPDAFLGHNTLFLSLETSHLEATLSSVWKISSDYVNVLARDDPVPFPPLLPNFLEQSN